MSTPLFSVVVATYNRAATLRRALDSVLEQVDAPLWEVIVVDDGSTDATPELLQSYGESIRTIRQDNAGPAIARNRGIEQSRAQYVCFLDSDDFWFPWTLATYRQVIEENGFPSFIVAAMDETTEDGIAAPRASGGPPRVCVAKTYFDFLGPFFMIGCPVMIVRRDVLLEAGCFPEVRMNCEDSDLCIRLGDAPGFVWIEAPATVAYVRHENSLTVQGLDKTLAGVRHIIRQEKHGLYPGGRARAGKRAMLVSTHARSSSVGLLRAGNLRDGMALYLSAFRFHIRAKRWKYLAAFPLMWMMSFGFGRRRSLRP